MDSEDPLKEFLKTTGWTPKDLLEKLKNYTSVNSENKNVDCHSSNSKSLDNSHVNNAECEIEKNIVHSTEDLYENNTTDESEEKKEKKIVEDHSSNVLEENVCTSSRIETKTTNQGDCGLTIRSGIEDVDENIQKSVGSCLSESKSDSNVFNEDDFSNTDEEEMEIKVTNSNIINEIIEDIFVNDYLETSTNEKTTALPEGIGMMQGVQVVESNVDDEDDDFEDECVRASSKNGELVNSVISSSTKKTLLQTHIKQHPSTELKSIIILSSSSENSLGLEENVTQIASADIWKSKNTDDSNEIKGNIGTTLHIHKASPRADVIEDSPTTSSYFSKNLDENIPNNPNNSVSITSAIKDKPTTINLINNEENIIDQLTLAVKEIKKNNASQDIDEDKSVMIENKNKKHAGNVKKQTIMDVIMESIPLSDHQQEVKIQSDTKEISSSTRPESVQQLNTDESSQDEEFIKKSEVHKISSIEQRKDLIINISTHTDLPTSDKEKLLSAKDVLQSTAYVTETTTNDTKNQAKQKPPHLSSLTAINKQLSTAVTDKDFKNVPQKSPVIEKYEYLNEIVENNKAESDEKNEKKADIFGFKMFNCYKQDNTVEKTNENRTEVENYSNKSQIKEEWKLENIDGSTIQISEEQNQESKRIQEILNKAIFIDEDDFEPQVKETTDKIVCCIKLERNKQVSNAKEEYQKQTSEYNVPKSGEQLQSNKNINNHLHVELGNDNEENANISICDNKIEKNKCIKSLFTKSEIDKADNFECSDTLDLDKKLSNSKIGNQKLRNQCNVTETAKKCQSNEYINNDLNFILCNNNEKNTNISDNDYSEDKKEKNKTIKDSLTESGVDKVYKLDIDKKLSSALNENEQKNKYSVQKSAKKSRTSENINNDLNIELDSDNEEKTNTKICNNDYSDNKAEKNNIKNLLTESGVDVKKNFFNENKLTIEICKRQSQKGQETSEINKKLDNIKDSLTGSWSSLAIDKYRGVDAKNCEKKLIINVHKLPTLKIQEQEKEHTMQTTGRRTDLKNTETVHICDNKPSENMVDEDKRINTVHKDDNIQDAKVYNSEIHINHEKKSDIPEIIKEISNSEIINIFDNELHEKNKLEENSNIKNVITIDKEEITEKFQDINTINISGMDEETGNVDVISAYKKTENTIIMLASNDTTDINTEIAGNSDAQETPEQDPDNVVENSEMTKESETVENIRDILKMQLTCLRTRKKSNFLSNLNTSLLNNFGSIKKEGLSKDNSMDNREVEKENSTDNLQIIEVEQEVYKNNVKDVENKIINVPLPCHNSSDYKDSVLGGDELYTQTNELGLVILNVQGGVDLDNEEKTEFYPANKNTCSEFEQDISVCESENIQSQFNSEEKPEEISEGTVFAEIRKIIRKQKAGKTFGEDILKSKKDISNYDFFKKDLPKGNTGRATLDKTNSFTLSTDNSQSSLNLDNSEETIEKNSPFVSNTLDEFLIENSKLNISYNIPKCEAEGGLKESMLKENCLEESPLILKKVVEIKHDPDGEIKRNSKFKAKTLAQKRKLLERQKMMDKKKLERLIEATKIKDEEDCRNYILYKDKKIFVKVGPNIKGKCFARIDSSIQNKKIPDISTNTLKKKISLLAEDRKLDEEIKYLPGPLSKKCTLQKNGNSYWETVTKKLPHIFLDVVPNIGNPFPIEVLYRLPQFGTKISSLQVDFALSVLQDKSKDTQLKTFRFPVKYQNHQEQILLRRQRLSVETGNSVINTDIECERNSVEAVIDDLIKYVEIKELEPSLLKEDDIQISPDDPINHESPTSKNNFNTIIKKCPKKKSKIDVELLRLNCKVVNVEIEEDEEKPCIKPFCQLGCVCKSLKCENILSYHCQKPKCMFDCSCPKERPITYDHTITFPYGTNVLSTDAVNRIEDEAKRNLAKIEREFTQTIIHTSDKTIVVGLGTRSKSRRATKMPVKYTDYFEDVEDERKPKINISRAEFYRKCTVNLPKLNLSKIIPYCLVHNLYNCHCEGRTKYFKENEGSRKHNYVIKNEISVDRKNLKRDRSEDNSEIFPPNKKHTIDDQIERSSDSSMSYQNEINSRSPRPGRTIRRPSKFVDSYTYESGTTTQKKSIENYDGDDDFDDSTLDCARTNEIPLKYLKKNIVHPGLFVCDFINDISEADLLRSKLFSQKNQGQILEADILKQYLIKSSGYISENFKRKRKQIIEVRSDVSSHSVPKPGLRLDGALQRRKRLITGKEKIKIIQPIFDGEIILDGSNMELLKKMGPKTVADGYARLIPWKYLTKGFKDGKLSIWCMIGQPSKLLMNKTQPYIEPPPKYIDIWNTTQTTQVIQWILRDKLPSNYDTDNVSFIVKENRGHFEICGVCTKNLKGMQQVPDLNPSTLVSNGNNNEQNFLHKDMNGKTRLLVLSKNSYKLQELIEEGFGDLDETSVDNTRLYMWAALPEVHRLCKWRMIYLNSDFTYLSFTKMKYTIKYTDLLSVNSIAKSSNNTILLKNAELQDKYDHKAFGIYFDSHYQDRLFIGPYFIHKHIDNDIETLRYINQTLVCTESFNKMRGQGDYKCGYWLVERPYLSGKSKKESPKPMNCAPNIMTLTHPVNTIDLTEEEGNEEKNEGGNVNADTKPDVLIHNGEKIKVIDAPPKKPEDFNRYIITNIPHFGYLGAFQYPKEIDIQWPFENKLLRFSSAKCAVDFLQTRLSSLLVPVPSSFKVTVIILTQIDLSNSKPIDASVLNGHYICGEFGFYNVLSLAEDICVEKIGMPKEEVLRIFLTRARSVVKERVEFLASLLKIEKPKQGDYDFVSVLNNAVEEISKQTELVKKNASVRNRLLTEKRSKARTISQLISQLPADQKVKENIKFRNIVCKTEPIEIQDSDDEDKNKIVNNTDNIRRNTKVSIGSPSTSYFSTNRPMQSILKPLMRVPVPPKGRLQNVRLIKSVTGKYMLVPAKTMVSSKNLPKGTEVVIQNNKIQSIREKWATITKCSDNTLTQTNNLATRAVSVVKGTLNESNPSILDENVIEINDEDPVNDNKSQDIESESDTQFDEYS